MTRLFVAIDLPRELQRLMAGSCRGLPGARRVPEGQIHLTLRFIGDADDRLFTRIREELAGICLPSFPVTVGEMGVFPPRGPCRVLWVGLQQSEALRQLQQRIEEAVVAAGCPREGRPFSPHITVARLKETSRSQVAPCLAARHDFSGETVPVRQFLLYSSILGREGSRHTVERAYPLSDPETNRPDAPGPEGSRPCSG